MEIRTKYTKPEDVRSPKAHWQLIEVVLDRGEGDCAYAVGEWDGVRRLGFRWNGDADNPIGNPQSRGLPTWTMLDPKLHEVVISLFPPDKQALTKQLLDIKFQFAASLGEGGTAVLLWDINQRPLVVGKIECGVIRQLVGIPTISSEECRLLVNSNMELITEIAEVLYAKNRFRVNENQVRIIDMALADLKPIANRFSKTVLEMRMLWATV